MAVALDAATVEHLARLLATERTRAPLVESVTRHLGVESWMLTVDATGRLRAASLLEGERGVPLPPVRPPEPPPGPLDRTYALAAGSALARMVGAPRATGRQLADLALREDDAELRGDAVRAVVDAAVRDPALERALLDGLGSADDAAIASVLAGVAGEAAEGLATLVADRARGRPLGARARGVLRLLRAR
jgi:hypothetical protein